MVTIAVKTYDMILSKSNLECITCKNEESAIREINRLSKLLAKEIKEGYISDDYRIELVDRISTRQMLY